MLRAISSATEIEKVDASFIADLAQPRPRPRPAFIADLPIADLPGQQGSVPQLDLDSWKSTYLARRSTYLVPRSWPVGSSQDNKEIERREKRDTRQRRQDGLRDQELSSASAETEPSPPANFHDEEVVSANEEVVPEQRSLDYAAPYPKQVSEEQWMREVEEVDKAEQVIRRGIAKRRRRRLWAYCTLIYTISA